MLQQFDFPRCFGITDHRSRRLSFAIVYLRSPSDPRSPRHPVRDTRTSGELYELSKLADFLPDLPRNLPKRGTPAGEIGLGRNCTLFDRLRIWAYVATKSMGISGPLQDRQSRFHH